MSRHFTEENIQMDKHVEGCSPSLATSEMQVETTVR